MPPCEQNDAGFVHYHPIPELHTMTAPALRLREPFDLVGNSTHVITVEAQMHMNYLFFVDPLKDLNDTLDCASIPSGRKDLSQYCRQTLQDVLPFLVNGTNVPLLLQYGDHHITQSGQANVPYLKKFRLRQPPCETLSFPSAQQQCFDRPRRMSHGFFEPIIFTLNNRRHFGKVKDVPQFDVPWEQKKNMAIFRGTLSGISPPDPFRNRTVVDRCRLLPRCDFVYQFSNSSLINAAITKVKQRNHIPKYIAGHRMIKSVISIKEHLRYKMLVSIEGNDVATSLKWMLFSNSVVLMRTPRFTSWALEELLEPWVHYVPLADNFHDAEEKVQWTLDHPDQAQDIARRATQWMHDFLMHPDAEVEQNAIRYEIMRRYEKHFKKIW